MRYFIFLILAFFSVPALAGVREVQGIEVSQTGVSGSMARDSAVAIATQKAVDKVWADAGRSPPAPILSAAQLQTVATYVDVTSESIQNTAYKATFNIGINLTALARLSGQVFSEEASVAVEPATTMDNLPPETDTPEWVLVVPLRKTGGEIALWAQQDSWIASWQRAAKSGLFMAAAGGDADDQRILTAAMLSGVFDLTDALAALAKKYRAPAVALLMLQSDSALLLPGEQAKLILTYVESESGQVQTLDSALSIIDIDNGVSIQRAVSEGQRLITEAATGTNSAATAQTYPLSEATGVVSSQNYNTIYRAPTVAQSMTTTRVRMPLNGPADLARYRQQVNSIPGASFEIVTLTRTYVEANIVHQGSEADLMRELQARGLSPR